MPFNLFGKIKGNQNKNLNPELRKSNASIIPFTYTWIITGKLAIGSIPKTQADWSLLESNDINKRFSCCYPQEHIYASIPSGWKSKEVSLPDHRLQEELTIEHLKYALTEIIELMTEDNGPTYLHCFAGQERSALIAVGVVCLTEKKDLFEGLAWIRQCYPQARPLYQQLEIMEKTLIEFNHST